ncbi:MAG: nucleotidyl transferase AbiEii/AbiGii toxin family protein [Nevskiales bacterium]
MKFASVEAVAKALDAAGVRYLVVGGLAVVLHGYSRATYDLDLVIQLQPSNVLAVFRALKPLGYKPLVPVTAEQFADAAIRQAWIEQKGMMVLNLYSDQHRETNIDLFVTEPFDFDAEYENAYVQELAPGLKLRAAGLNVLIEMKRKAGRAKDLADIEQLLSIQKGLGDG